MLRGLYTAGTGMMIQRSRMDVVTNNIVNAETTGYKKDIYVPATFDDVMMRRINDGNDPQRASGVGVYSFGAHNQSVYTDFSQGNVEPTGLQTDLMLTGDAFFTVSTDEGMRYTRAGNYFVNSDGYLTNQDGHYLMGSTGRVYVGYGDFSVDAQGNVTSDGQNRGKLSIVSFADNQTLRKQGDNLFSGTGAVPAAEYSVLQGYQENSNVEISSEMVDMITLYRAYEVNQKILTMTDETLGMAASRIGSLR